MCSTIWIKYFFLLVFVTSLPIALFNYWMDPLWTFSHSHIYNQNQKGFNERQLKTNKIYFSGLREYDAILLGSSRSTYINQNDFNNMKVFNLACADMLPYEYNKWIKVSKKVKGREFKYIIIGLDFWGSNQTLKKDKKAQNKTPVYFFNQSERLMYRWTSLISFDTYTKSKENLENYFAPSTIDYTRKNIKSTIIIKKRRKEQIVRKQYKLYKNKIYGKHYTYQKNWIKLMMKLKQENPKTKFITFTTPISAELFELLIKEGNYNDYKIWLKNIITVFGSTYNFMGINPITSNTNNYPDLHHFYPNVGTLIATKLSDIDNNESSVHEYLLNSKNIKFYLKKLDTFYK